MARRPTILDVAHRAGVSKGAVSFALNGRPGLAPATRNRILVAAQELDWQPSSHARAEAIRLPLFVSAVMITLLLAIPVTCQG